MRILPQCLLRVQEFCGRGIAFEGFDGGGVEGCGTAIRGGDDDLDVVCEDFIRMGELGLLARGRLADFEVSRWRWCGSSEFEED